MTNSPQLSVILTNFCTLPKKNKELIKLIIKKISQKKGLCTKNKSLTIQSDDKILADYKNLESVIKELRELNSRAIQYNEYLANGDKTGLIQSWIGDIIWADEFLSFSIGSLLYTHAEGLGNILNMYAHNQTVKRILELNSKYAFQLFIILESLYSGKQDSTYIDSEYLKDKLISSTQYSRFSDLNRLVISPTLKILNNITGTNIQYNITVDIKNKNIRVFHFKKL